MLIQSPPLADQFASLRADFAASPHRGWLPSALHALILACLAHIFGRLDQIFLLLQAGALPIQAIRHTSPQQPSCPSHTPSANIDNRNMCSAEAARAIAKPAIRPARMSRPAHAPRARNPVAGVAPSRRSRSCLPRAAPPDRCPSCRESSAELSRATALLSLRNSNYIASPTPKSATP